MSVRCPSILLSTMTQSTGPFVIETPRLYITHWKPESQRHCSFFVRLSNCPSFRAAFGANRGAHTEEDARAAIKDRYVANYDKGYGGMLVLLKQPQDGASDIETALEHAEPLGAVSLLMHGEHTLPDIGFGLIDEAQGKGYATEAARAYVEHAKTVLGFPHVVAFCGPSNSKSRRTIERLGLVNLGEHELKAFSGAKGLVFASEGVHDFAELAQYNIC